MPSYLCDGKMAKQVIPYGSKDMIETAYEIENSYGTALYDLEEREADLNLTTLHIDERDGMDMIRVRRRGTDVGMRGLEASKCCWPTYG
jgi:hypothetical protein